MDIECATLKTLERRLKPQCDTLRHFAPLVRHLSGHPHVYWGCATAPLATLPIYRKWRSGAAHNTPEVEQVLFGLTGDKG